MKASGPFAALNVPAFRLIWLASLAANTGYLIQGVGSAWTMTSMADANWVAMVQTAVFLPMAVFAIPAGAIADMADRRKVLLAAISLQVATASALAFASFAGLLSPWVLLAFCFLIGSGVALQGPAFQASAGELVPPNLLAQAVGLNGISYNVARSIGPAVGGFVVAAFGASAAFVCHALFGLPMIAALRAWQRREEPSRLPPEGLFRAVGSGLRYVANMQPVRRAVTRAFVAGLLVAVMQSLMPLVSRDLLQGDARTFGILLGAFGIGAVSGIFVLHRVRALGTEFAFNLCSAAMAVSFIGIGFSRTLWATVPLLMVSGACWMMQTTLIGIVLQLTVPRWVVGRTVAAYQSSIALGIAGGSWLWGLVARDHGIAAALIAAGLLHALAPLLGRLIPIANREEGAESDTAVLVEPDIALGITGRSGPIGIEVTYRVAAERARDFYNLMNEARKIRSRNGASDWSLARDIADPELWQERFRCPTWNDYLRMRARRTREEGDVHRRVGELHIGLEPVRIRRWLERPTGSVRWRAESPDRGIAEIPTTVGPPP